ncbi:MAG: amino acid adenylation domain-containing protein [Verrucomicrobia bacterium]|nr:amino acid adenylation domain-containing protein [Verrucomicrobiota bacterium]MBI3867442.1 amino acid adenylation domain-containing protein [Verrucomicrobiota bacterium]
MRVAREDGAALVATRPADLGLLHSFFERSVRRWPRRVAVEIPPGDGRPSRSFVTYAELNAHANALARRIQPFIHGECVVAVLLPRTTARLYSSQLAILKAGAAYTCVDPSFPDERIREILADAEIGVLLTDSAGLARSEAWSSRSLARLDVNETPGMAEASTEDPDPASRASWLSPESLAYVIYTSGTTGRPKGVMIEHRSIANLVASDLEEFALSSHDRVAQGSSAAYDSSVEEIWLAFAAGATVVALDEAASRLGPDLIPWLRNERITVFCPPPTLLRATGCGDPARALPDLSLLYVGGEPLPRDVADLWSQGRRLVNGYGPTECAVTCLRERISNGQPITIGRVVTGAQAWVLNENLERVADGEKGELCVGGVGVARGYWNRPELTAEKFITHPQCGRLYRTGDLVHRDPDGRFFYHGRMDSQVKLRGYRVELGEIESRLATCPGVRSAACRVQEDAGRQSIAAFIVPTDPARPPSPQEVRAWTAASLPDYMVPAHYGFLAELPTSVGGKLNRSALPPLTHALPPPDKPQAPPRCAIETKVEAAFRRALRLSRPASIDENFFTDLGGDSLSAATVITFLRDDPATGALAVRDLYEAPTIAQLARKVGAAEPGIVNQEDPLPSDTQSPILATAIQSAWLLKSLVLGALAAYVIGFHAAPALAASLGLIPFILVAPALLMAAVAIYTPWSIAMAVLAKRILVGRYQPTRAKVWGSFYIRNWVVQRAVGLVPWWILEGTDFQIVALRALGARIGRRVHLHRGVHFLQGGWDLLEIGDDVTLAQDATLRLVELDAGHVVVGAIRIGAGCTLDIQSSVAGGARLEDGAYLAARSSLSHGATIPRGERWDGIPAKPAGQAPHAPSVPSGERVLSPLGAGLLLIACRLALFIALALPAELFAILFAHAYGLTDANAMIWWDNPTFDVHLLLASVLIAVAPTPFVLVLEALACRWMGRVQEGVSSRWSPGYARLWLKAGLVDSGSRWLYGTIFWPAWLRLAGMKVGRGCELSSLIDTIPESVEIGARTFCADGIYIGTPWIHRGAVTIARVRLGQNTFVGNGAIIAGGQQLPDHILLGVCTVAADAPARPDTGWFGHPPFELPRREIITADSSLTHDPTPARYAVRFCWEALRFGLPMVGVLAVQLWFLALGAARESLSWSLFLGMAVPLLTLAAAILPTLAILAIKWTLLGRVRPGVHPLWSSWASRWDFVCLAWSLYASEAVSALNGTLYLNALIRMMGVKVGRGVILGHGVVQDLPDPDLLTFEDGATVDCLFQAHTFEDRVLKLDRIIIRRQATVGRQAVLLYGADIGARTRVSPNSVVMKHERLPPNRNYAGFPLRQVNEDPW